MSRLGTVRFAGKSGKQYKFAAYPLDTAFRRGMGAVYIVTRRKQADSGDGFTHRRIRLGQTADLHRPLAGDDAVLTSRGANCICVHGEKERAVRLGIQRDLIERSHSDDNA